MKNAAIAHEEFYQIRLPGRDQPIGTSNGDDFDRVLTEYDSTAPARSPARPAIFTSPGTCFATGTKTETSYDRLDRVVSLKTLSDNQEVTTSTKETRVQ